MTLIYGTVCWNYCWILCHVCIKIYYPRFASYFQIKIIIYGASQNLYFLYKCCLVLKSSSNKLKTTRMFYRKVSSWPHLYQFPVHHCFCFFPNTILLMLYHNTFLFCGSLCIQYSELFCIERSGVTLVPRKCAIVTIKRKVSYKVSFVVKVSITYSTFHYTFSSWSRFLRRH